VFYLDLCNGVRIGQVSIGRGTDPNAPAVWTATLRSNAVGVTALPIASSVAGYRVTGTAPSGASTFSVTEANSTITESLAAIFEFRPASLRPGEVLTSNGSFQSIASWRLKHPPCG
jgi:hypothetical protein